ncbi:MAG: ABC transporter permease [archaeon GB-1867-035]|nr:ABC transporter permease [Candidatus Culexmicrobium profundum]
MEEKLEVKRSDWKAWMRAFLISIRASTWGWTMYTSSFIISVCSMVVDALVFFMISLLVGGRMEKVLPSGMSYASFILVNFIVNQFINTPRYAFFELLQSCYFGGAMDFLILSSPISFSSYLLGSIVFLYLMGIMRSGIFVVISLILGVSFSSTIDLGALLVVLLLGILCMTGIGLIAGSVFFLLNVKDEDLVNWILDRAVHLFSGFYFPIELLPKNVRIIGIFIPQTYIYDSMRRILVLGESLSQTIIHSIFVLLTFMLILLPLGYFLFTYSIRIAEKKGELTRWT